MNEEQPSRIHDLKIWPEPFRAVCEGRKRFEFRLDDRRFAEGDRLRLQEWNPATGLFTGVEWTGFITYASWGPSFGIPVGYVVLSIEHAEWD